MKYSDHLIPHENKFRSIWNLFWSIFWAHFQSIFCIYSYQIIPLGCLKAKNMTKIIQKTFETSPNLKISKNLVAATLLRNPNRHSFAISVLIPPLLLLTDAELSFIEKSKDPPPNFFPPPLVHLLHGRPSLHLRGRQ